MASNPYCFLRDVHNFIPAIFAKAYGSLVNSRGPVKILFFLEVEEQILVTQSLPRNKSLLVPYFQAFSIILFCILRFCNMKSAG